MDEERQRYEQYNQYGPQVKVYSFNSTSWLSRIILIIILAVVLAAVVSLEASSIRSRCCHFSGCYCFLYLWALFNGIIHIL